MLERWHAPSIVPSNVAAVSRVQDHVLSRLDNERAIVLEIRFDDRSVSARDLAAYLTLLDAAFGRTDPSGFRSYSLRARETTFRSIVSNPVLPSSSCCLPSSGT